MKLSRLKTAVVAFLAATNNTSIAKSEVLSLNITPVVLEQASQSEEATTLDLGGGFIEFLLTGRTRQEQAPPRSKTVHHTNPALPAAIRVVPYYGALSPGEVILNVTKKKVYRILPDGLMEVYNNRTDLSSLINSTATKPGN